MKLLLQALIVPVLITASAKLRTHDDEKSPSNRWWPSFLPSPQSSKTSESSDSVSLATGTASASATASATATATATATARTEADNLCPEGFQNRWPSSKPKSFTMTSTKGTAYLDDLFDITDEMKTDAQWNMGAYWYMRVKCISDSHKARTFSFAGGTKGFLQITCPPSPAASLVEAKKDTRVVLADPENNTLAFQYVDKEVWTSGNVTITDICLAPQSCDNYTCPDHAKHKGAGLYGGSELQCCKTKLCQEEAIQCAPSSQWEEHVNYSQGKAGDNMASCCTPKTCPADLCANMTDWKDKEDKGTLGSTPEECCEEMFCATHTCPEGLWVKKPHKLSNGSVRRGSTDDECCTPKYCTNSDPDMNETFACGPSDEWRLKPDASSIRAFNKSACCDALKCDEVVCANDTKWAGHKGIANETVGHTEEQCCKKRLCSTYTCNPDKLKRLRHPTSRQGSTDEECCTNKTCQDYQCGDTTKWSPKAYQFAKSGLDRPGNTQEECCNPIYCLPEICDPSSAWKFKPGGETIQGSTIEQCCDAKYCEDFICDTDVNHTGQGTAWYRKQDTNTYKYQGSTERECCVPIYCSQYVTAHETRWKRKTAQGLQGSTDAECYDKRLCSDHCCADAGKELVPNADKRQGSTDAECCIDTVAKA